MKPGKRLISLIFFVAAGLLTASVVFTYRIGIVAIQANRKMTDQLRILQNLEEFLSTFKDVDIGENGYLLTGQEPDLKPYDEALGRLNAKIDFLRSAKASGDLTPETVDQVIKLTQEKIAELNRRIAVRREKGLSPALEISFTGRGRELTDQIY